VGQEEDKHFAIIMEAMGGLVADGDDAKVNVLRALLESEADDRALVYDERTGRASIAAREDADGKYEPGCMPAVWISGQGVRRAFGEVAAKDVLDTIDKAVAKKAAIAKKATPKPS
jgi:hypothetical protein